MKADYSCTISNDLDNVHLNLDTSKSATLMQFHFLFAFLPALPSENKNDVSNFTECLCPVPRCLQQTFNPTVF